MIHGSDVIKEARIRRCLTQLDVALVIGTSDRQLRRWESGEQPVPFNVVRNICQACGVGMIEILQDMADGRTAYERH